MRINRFEEIEAWQLARKLTQAVYKFTKKPKFTSDYGLKDRIQRAAGSSMHNIAEGFDSESNVEFMRFLRYAKRSCTEVQSQLYIALDQKYIESKEFEEAFDLVAQTRAAIHGFIRYLEKYKKQKK